MATDRASGATAVTDRPQSSRPTVLIAFAVDVVVVTAFAAIGRASHDSGVFGDDGLGLLTTAGPFVAALVIAWVVLRAWRTPYAPARIGIPLWLIVVAVGMGIRILTGQGTALPFVIVATVTLLLFLVGWRALVALARRFGDRQ